MNQAGLFDVNQGKLARDMGIKQAVDHAGIEWNDSADFFLDQFLIVHKEDTFMTEDLRAWSHDLGLPMPPDNRAWGGVVGRASRLNKIKSLGYTQAKAKNCHRCPKNIWAKVQ